VDPTGTMTIYLNPGTYDISIGGGQVTSFTLTPDPNEPPPRRVTQIADPDPRNHALYIARAYNYGLTVEGSHLLFQDFADIKNFYGCIGLSTTAAGQTDLTFKNCGGRTLSFGARCVSATHLKFDSCKMYGQMNSDKWWIAWGDIKDGSEQAKNVRKCAFDLGVASYVEIVNCLIDEFFDGILSDALLDETGGVRATAHNVEVHRTTFNHVWDDAWQMNASLYEINYHDNYHYGAGPGVESVGAGSANAAPGTVYIHHNIIDTTGRLLYFRRRGRAEMGLAEANALSSHSKVKNYTVPRKIYYNTIVTGALSGQTTIGWALHDAAAPNSQAQHEVYNNVLKVIDGRLLGRDFYADTGREIYDGNVYWHWQDPSPSGYKSPWRFFHISSTPSRIDGQPIRTVDELRGVREPTQILKDSQVYYAPGWEASGLSDDPDLDHYRPKKASCKDGAVDLTNKQPRWPGTYPYERWRGAVKPL
jgi:hypothetical protein